MQKKTSEPEASRSDYETIPTAQVPHGRKGKHNALISQILSNLLTLQPGNALKIPLLDLRKQKIENIRAAINRAGKKVNLQIATSSDDYFFYVWIDNKRTVRG
jgi:hypothetical protein